MKPTVKTELRTKTFCWFFIYNICKTKFKYVPVAQLAAQKTFNFRVVGSNPIGHIMGLSANGRLHVKAHSGKHGNVSSTLIGPIEKMVNLASLAAFPFHTSSEGFGLTCSFER